GGGRAAAGEQRGRKAEEQCGDECEHAGECEDAHVRAQKGDLARTWWGKKCSQRRGARPGERGGHHTADEGKQKRFGEALLHDAAARCAQGRAHGELMLPRLTAGGWSSAR